MGLTRWGNRPFISLSFLAIALLSASAASAFDADADGLGDEADAFPCKAGSAAVVFSPSQGDFNLTLFEDQWPGDSDLDFNDAVVASNFIFEMTADGRVRSLRGTFNVLALGGVFNNGLGLRLVGVPTQAVSSIRQTIGAGPSTALSPQTTDPANLTVRLLSNMRSLFGNREGIINSDPSQPAITGQPMEVEITFSTPQAIDASAAPFDLYIFRTQTPSHEVHRPNFPGTAEMDESLFGSGNDRSTGTRHFIDQTGLPYALSLPSIRPWPREGVSIDHLYPNIIQFAASGGTQAQDFYIRGIDKDYAYTQPVQVTPDVTPPDPSDWQSPLALQWVGPNTIPSDTSCINAWGLSIEFGTSRDTYGYASAVDGSSVIVVGYTRANLGGNNAGGQDLFVAKYQRDQASGANAVPLWVKQFGGSGNDAARSVAVASNGDIYVAGETRSALQSQTNAGASDAFLMKLSSDGTHQWTRLLGAAGSEGANAVAISSSAVYIAGGTTSAPLPGASYLGATPASFLARYDLNGNRQWTQQYRADDSGAQNYSYSAALALDLAGNVYVAGAEHRYSQNPSASSNIFVARHDPTGARVWTQHLGDYGYYQSTSDYRLASAFALAVTSSNEILVAGNWEAGSLVTSWNGLSRTSADRSADALLIKLSSDGTQQWAQSLGSTDGKADYALTLSVDSAGNSYLGGYTAGALPGQTWGGNYDYFGARFSPAGNRDWVSQHNTANDDGAIGSYVDNAGGNLYLIGNTGEITGNPVSYANQYYGFISRHPLSNGTRSVFNLTATPTPISGTCCKAVYDAGTRTSGVYTIDPDGAGTSYAPFDVYCDMTTSGGGWTLVLNRNKTMPTQYASGVLRPVGTPGDSNDGRAVTRDKWTALRAISTQALSKLNCGAASGDYCSDTGDKALIAQLATLARANCKALAADLTEPCIAWNETVGCTGSGMDYSLWFGFSNDYTRGPACYDQSSLKFFSSSSQYYWTLTAAMYVR